MGGWLRPGYRVVIRIPSRTRATTSCVGCGAWPRTCDAWRRGGSAARPARHPISGFVHTLVEYRTSLWVPTALVLRTLGPLFGGLASRSGVSETEHSGCRGLLSPNGPGRAPALCVARAMCSCVCTYRKCQCRCAGCDWRCAARDTCAGPLARGFPSCHCHDGAFMAVRTPGHLVSTVVTPPVARSQPALAARGTAATLVQGSLGSSSA